MRVRDEQVVRVLQLFVGGELCSLRAKTELDVG